ncbi:MULTISPECIES: hypothetical protein [Actinosynnema]|uniref:hypothetical protein n=1 Tax=Actinosynnema TaxID=40566 RepID=UPI0020A4415B|nr:hypothetical protein [Actinosynnema pretiosum]MCP2097486.1 hypothetical protein [Actinosynnema pretiosum]
MYEEFDPWEDPDPPLIRDADIEMAEAAVEADRLHNLRRNGVCTHSSACGLPASGEIFYFEQIGLKPEQVACREHTNGCNAVFDSNEAWDNARLAL